MGAISRYFKPIFGGVTYVGVCWMKWLGRYSKHPEQYPLETRHKDMREGFRRLGKYLNVDIICEGLENLPTDENIFIIGNHIGDFDPLAIGGLIKEPTSFVGKIEIKNFPLIREGMAALDAILMDRNDLKQSLKCMQRLQKELQTIRKNWVVFPEGTRRKDSRLLMADFHPGTFRAPMKAGVKICPFAIVGTDRIFHIHPCTYRRYPVHIKFLKPITPEQYKDMSTDELARLCQNQIQSTISFDLRPKDHALMSKLYPKKYKLI